jgi:hypothetical protein
VTPRQPGAEISELQVGKLGKADGPAAMAGDEAEERTQVLVVAATRQVGEAALGAQPRAPAVEDGGDVGAIGGQG